MWNKVEIFFSVTKLCMIGISHAFDRLNLRKCVYVYVYMTYSTSYAIKVIIEGRLKQGKRERETFTCLEKKELIHSVQRVVIALTII